MYRQVITAFSALLILTAQAALANESGKLPVVTSAALGLNMRVPWSQPVQVDDPFDGKFVAVFDRNYFSSRLLDARRVDVVSLWNPKEIRVLLAARDRECILGGLYDTVWGHTCVEIGMAKKITDLAIKVRDQIYRIPIQNGSFPVSEDLAIALKDAPVENVKIRLTTEDGETVDSEIGKDTVKAWKTIYGKTF